jgi:hypothetical protein
MHMVLALDGGKKEAAEAAPSCLVVLRVHVGQDVVCGTSAVVVCTPTGVAGGGSESRLFQTGRCGRECIRAPLRACPRGKPTISWSILSLAKAGRSPPLLKEREFAPKLAMERSARRTDHESVCPTQTYQKINVVLVPWLICPQMARLNA